MKSAVLALLAALVVTLPAVHAADAPAAFIPVRAGEDGRIPQAALDAALDAVGRSGSPRHVVILVHGYDTPYYRSAEEYEQVAVLLRGEFARLNEPVTVVGLQWPSSAGALREWLPKSFASFALKKLGFRNAVRDPYLAKIPIDRAVGRVGLRQLVFGLQERFPDAGVHLIGHSMGTEVIAHAVMPDITKVPEAGPEPEAAERPCNVGLVALLGSDLDYDAVTRAPWRTSKTGLPRLIWVTFPRFDEEEDVALRVRRLPRGKAAFGNRVPLVRSEQYDDAISARALVYDTDEIPPDHQFLKYLSPSRLRRLAEAMVTLDEPGREASPVLVRLSAILKAPADPRVIAPYIDAPDTSAKLYALWRLEQLHCQGNKHLVDGYLVRVLRKSMNVDWLARERRVSPCWSVRQGYWPSTGMVQEALAAGRLYWEADPAHQGFYTQPIPGCPPGGEAAARK